MKGLAAFVLAFACLPALAQSTRVIGKAGVWVNFDGQGFVTYRAADNGSFINISCDVAYSEDQRATGITLEIAGKLLPAQTQVRFTVDGKAISFPSDRSGGVWSRDCPECAGKFAQLWSMLREGRRLEITSSDGRSVEFPLKGLSELMPAKPCAARTEKATSRNRLPGTWVFIRSKTRFPDACQGDTGISYEADGTYQLLEESGTWRLTGDRLTETPTEAHEGAQPGSVKIGEPFTSRLQWKGPDTFTKTFPGGKVTLRRCP